MVVCALTAGAGSSHCHQVLLTNVPAIKAVPVLLDFGRVSELAGKERKISGDLTMLMLLRGLPRWLDCPVSLQALQLSTSGQDRKQEAFCCSQSTVAAAAV